MSLMGQVRGGNASDGKSKVTSCADLLVFDWIIHPVQLAPLFMQLGAG